MKNAFFQLALFLFFSACIDIASADGDGVLAVGSVEIKQQGANSLQAKEKALCVAMRRSFNNLLIDRLKLRRPLPSFSHREISDCVYDCSIDSEKHSDQIYIGEISYRFSEGKVASLLKKHGVKCNLISEDIKQSYLRVAIYSKDFEKIASLKSCIVESFSAERIIVKVRENSFEDFKKSGITYAQL